MAMVDWSRPQPFAGVWRYPTACHGLLRALRPDRSLINASLVVMTIGLMDALVAYLKFRFTYFRKLVEGTAIVLHSTGQWNDTAMRAKAH